MRARLLAIDSNSIGLAANAVRRGFLIVFPTDTVYGLGCDPLNHAAVRRLFEAKGRESKAVPVLCASAGRAEELVKLGGRAAELAREYWPGALTIVAALRRPVPSQLTQGRDYLGVRVPAHSRCLELIAACGGWLTGTSANRSGRPSARSAGEAMDELGDSVDFVLDGGRLSGQESTVVKVVGGEVTILRTGPIGVGNEVEGRRTS
ncbi:MAG TPA: L-threonylcarbamoyladenylate synthase [Nitrososphaerales archaeon]|nr:L-threonylcarbamoyladenylate synthase [Nitrososphaerales archaeon]